ncbi:MAG: ribosome maturation factor RimP [Nitrospirae bacterium]|nr:ribosome maturation factor RimP [Nitrospirota bacterium]
MDIKSLENKIRGMIEPVVESLGMRLFDLKIGKARGRYLLRIFIDKEEGISLADCELASHEIEAILDVEDPIPYSYVLEVSSPGLDRPMKLAEDYKKYSGRTVRVVTNDPVNKQNFFVGKILESDNASVTLLLTNNEKIRISLENISKARLEVEV